ncbi:ribbon-helix-helix domain-containing protein [Methylocystis iwaonis]|uniref:Antitoxin-like ribbon-helix-helix domain-containing protein n=1 Tax=Methylocystis iwaonis TaxID=2885079 RepID=A0ABN6VHK8_9HYPH|nr:ribbon-helix-helix domain-containing protein [Methylocystis iwaonis]BDV33707.1 hypothetical protein SS37A_12360 [Methylocystis iwaonis]
MKKLLTPIEPEMHKRLKMLAVRHETTLEALTRAALAAYLSKHDTCRSRAPTASASAPALLT